MNQASKEESLKRYKCTKICNREKKDNGIVRKIRIVAVVVIGAQASLSDTGRILRKVLYM